MTWIILKLISIAITKQTFLFGVLWHHVYNVCSVKHCIQGTEIFLNLLNLCYQMYTYNIYIYQLKCPILLKIFDVKVLVVLYFLKTHNSLNMNNFETFVIYLWLYDVTQDVYVPILQIIIKKYILCICAYINAHIINYNRSSYTKSLHIVR